MKYTELLTKGLGTGSPLKADIYRDLQRLLENDADLEIALNNSINKINGDIALLKTNKIYACNGTCSGTCISCTANCSSTCSGSCSGSCSSSCRGSCIGSCGSVRSCGSCNGQ